jgi:integrase
MYIVTHQNINTGYILPPKDNTNIKYILPAIANTKTNKNKDKTRIKIYKKYLHLLHNQHQNSAQTFTASHTMTFRLKNFIAKNGERFTQIYEADNPGFPLFHPTLYCALELRNNITHKTQKNHMRTIKKILTWGQNMKIPIDSRFEKNEFLSMAECRSLVNFLAIKRNSTTGDTICNAKINDALITSSKYLVWLAFTICGTKLSSQAKESIALMEAEILRQKRKKGSSAAASRKIIAKKLSTKMETELKNIFSSLLSINTDNPNLKIYFRTMICLQILYETGMRIGELLSLQLSSYDDGTGGDEPSLSVKRSHDDPKDDRVNQPTAKTLERMLSISEDLNSKITYYLDKHRQYIPGVGFELDDFIFVNHIRGNRQGKAVQCSAFENSISRIREKNHKLKGLHPHLLRHHWNYLFSIEAKSLGFSQERTRTTREYCMGWADNSQQSARYNLRDIQEDAMKIGKKIANDTTR